VYIDCNAVRREMFSCDGRAGQTVFDDDDDDDSFAAGTDGG